MKNILVTKHSSCSIILQKKAGIQDYSKSSSKDGKIFLWCLKYINLS